MTDEQDPSPAQHLTRRELRRRTSSPQFVYVGSRVDSASLEAEVEAPHSSGVEAGRLIVPWTPSIPGRAEYAPHHGGRPVEVTLPLGDWTVVPVDDAASPGPAEPDAAPEGARAEQPTAFKKIRDVISKMRGKTGDGDDAGELQFLDPTSEQAKEAATGEGEWWDESAADSDHEVSNGPEGTTGETAPAPEQEQTREEKKAEAAERAAAAKEEKKRQAEVKRDHKREAKAESKRQAIAAKEQKELVKKRLREAEDEEKIEQDEIRTRARREKKTQADWKRKQKRREAIRKNGGKEGFWQGTSAPKPIEIANAIRSLAIILDTNPAEIDAVKMMSEEFAGTRIGDAFDRICNRLVKDNLTLVEAFAPETLFPSVVHNMLKVGAKTAKPGPALRSAVDLMDSGNDNKRKMRNAVREPAILAIASLGILFGTAWGVMPVFLEMYEAMELEIGPITGFVLVFADVSMWVIGILGAIGLAILTWWWVSGRSSLRVRIAIDRWKLHAPLIGKGEQSGEVFQMFNILDSYLSVGSTERESLLNTASALENRAVKRHLRAVANGLTRGEKTFAEFLDDDMFPRMARSILGAGQRSGQSVQVVKNLRDIYANEAAIEGEQSVQKVVGLVSALSSILFTVTATIVTVPPLEIFGSTLGYRG